jgi:hypothetical protein
MNMIELEQQIWEKLKHPYRRKHVDIWDRIYIDTKGYRHRLHWENLSQEIIILAAKVLRK